MPANTVTIHAKLRASSIVIYRLQAAAEGGRRDVYSPGFNARDSYALSNQASLDAFKNAPTKSSRRKDNLGSWSGWFSDNSKYYQKQGGIYAIASIANGIAVVPAALIDTVPRAIRESAAESRVQIRRSAARSKDPVQIFMANNVAIPLSHFGEFTAQAGNVVGASAPLLIAGTTVPAAGAVMSSRLVVGSLSTVGLYSSGREAVDNYHNGTLSGSDAFFVTANAVGMRYALSSGQTAPQQQQGGLTLYKFQQEQTMPPGGWRDGDYMYSDPWYKMDPKGAWQRNKDAVLEVMEQGGAIYDSYRDPATGLRIPTGGALGKERALIESGGRNPSMPWTYDPATGQYLPQ